MRFFLWAWIGMLFAAGALATEPGIDRHDVSALTEALQEVEQDLEQLAEQEAVTREIWMGRQRKLAAVQQEVLREDDTLRELQDRIQSHLREIEEMQRELERELLARSNVGDEDPDAPSQEELQREIMSMRSERSALIQRRNRLQQQILSAERAADSE